MYQEEVKHRGDISQRLLERKSHLKRRRSEGRTTGTSKGEQVRKVAPVNGYRISN